MPTNEPSIRLKVVIDPAAGIDASLDAIAARIQRRLGMDNPNGAAARATTLMARTAAAESRFASRFPDLDPSGGAGQSSRLRNAAARAQAAAGGAFDAITLPAEKTLATISKVGEGFVKLAATIYTLEKAGKAIERAFVSPFEKVITSITGATESFRRWEIAVSGSTGSLSASKRLDDALIRTTINGPFSIAETQQNARQMQLIGPLSERLTGSPAEAAAGVESFSKLVRKLQIISGEDSGQVSESLRLAIDGSDPRALRRLKLSPSEVAGSIGEQPGALKGNQLLSLKAIETFANQVVPESAIRDFGDLFSQRAERVKEALNKGLRDLGEGGSNGSLYDKLTGALAGISSRVLTYLDSAQWKGRADKIADAIEKTVGNVTKGALALVNGMAGLEDSSGTPDAIAHAIEVISTKLSDWSDKLPGIAKDVGEGLRTLTSDLHSFVESIRGLSPKNLAANAAISTVNGFAQTNQWLGLQLMSAINPFPSQRQAFSQMADAMLHPGVPVPGNAPAAAPSPATSSAIEQITKRVGMDVWNIGDRNLELSAKLRSITSSAGRLSDFDPQKDQFQHASGLLRGGLDVLAGGYTFAGEKAGPNLFEKAAKGRDELLERIDSGIADYALQMGNELFDPKHLITLASNISNLGSIRQKVVDQYQAAIDAARKEIVDSFGRSDVARIQGLSGDSASARAKLTDAILAGATKEAQQAAQLTGFSASAFGKSAIPVEALAKINNAQLGAHADLIERNGNLNFQPRKEIDQALLDYYDEAMGGVTSDYRRASEQYKSSGSDESLRAMENLGAVVDDLKVKMRDLKFATNDCLKDFVSFGDAVQDHLSNSIGSSLEGLIEGTNNLKDVWKSFAKSIVSDFSQMSGKFLVSQLFGGAGGDGGRSGLGGIFASLFGANGGGGNANGSANGGGLFGSLVGGIGGLFKGGGAAAPSVTNLAGLAAANGAVWKGGFTPIHAFADGGIVNRPVIGIVGEGSAPAEAMVPLPNGRSIPVEFTQAGQQRGGGGGDIYFVQDHAEAFRRGFKENRDMLIDTVSGNIRGGGKVHRSIRNKSKG